MAASTWTPVEESNAPAGWTPVDEAPRSAASPIAPPAIQRPAMNMHPSFLMGDPNSDATPQSLPDVVKGMAASAGHLAVTAPVVAHRLLQKHGIVAPGSDLFPGEHTMDQVEKQDVPNAAMTMLGAEGMEAPEPGVPRIAPKISPPAEGPGMLARVAKVGVQRIPGVKLGTDLLDAVRGPEAPTPEPPKPAKPAIAKVPETGGIQWGTGGKGPIDLRGQRIPVKPVYPGAPFPEKPAVNPGAPFPEKPPAEVFKARGLETGGQAPQQLPSSALGKIAVVPEKAPRPITYPPEAPNVIERPKAVRPERSRFLEDKSTQEEIRDAADREDQSRLSQERREWFARNQPGFTKGELMEQAAKAVKAPIAKVTSAEPRGVAVATPETDDLTPVLKKSLAQARKQKGASR